MRVCLWGFSGAVSVQANPVEPYIYVCERQVLCVRVITGKGRTVTRWAYTTFKQAVNFEWRKCVGSMSGELGFTTLERGSRGGGLVCVFIPQPPLLHPTCFQSVCLIPSLLCLCVT